MSIDILMATYRGEEFLKEQMDSIMMQSNQDWHLYVSDDNSPDATWEILSEYVARFPDKITIRKNEINSGSAAANFYGMLPLATGDYAMFADQDDIWLPKKVETTLRAMKAMEDKYGKNCPLVVHTDLTVVDSEGNLLEESMCAYQKLQGSGRTFAKQLVQNTVTGCTMMCNRALLDKLMVIPEGTIMHDWWIALVAACFGKIGFVRTPQILYRRHDHNVEGAKDFTSISSVAKQATQKESIALSLAKTYRQADAFWELYWEELTPVQIQILMAYRSLEGESPLKKREIMMKNGFWKTGLARKLGQLMYV